MSLKIRFFSEEIDFVLEKRVKVRQWITGVIRAENKNPGTINYIFCSDGYLLDLNKAYLQHDTLTDIITFPNEDIPTKISGDIYISVERVKENALKFQQEPGSELKRVMVHGVLHLLGYHDKTRNEKTLMRSKEDYYLLRYDEYVSRGT